MRRSTRQRLAWQVVGLLFSLVGTVVFLFFLIDVYTAEPTDSFENLSRADWPVLLASVSFLVVGRYVSYRFGGGLAELADPRDDRSRQERLLAEHGYRIPPTESDRDEPAYAYEDGEVYVRCPDCGAPNDNAFDYCGECAAELPS